jgi:hypothetical protein
MTVGKISTGVAATDGAVLGTEVLIVDESFVATRVFGRQNSDSSLGEARPQLWDFGTMPTIETGGVVPKLCIGSLGL